MLAPEPPRGLGLTRGGEKEMILTTAGLGPRIGDEAFVTGISSVWE